MSHDDVAPVHMCVFVSEKSIRICNGSKNHISATPE